MSTDTAMAFMLSGVIALISIPLILQRVPPNRLYGFRSAKTLSSPAIWYRANTYSGWALFIAAIATSFLGLVGVPAVVALLVPLAAALAMSIRYVTRLPE